MRANRFLFIATLALLSVETVHAQLSGNNLMEYQFGNIPDTDPADLSTLYDQLNLQYRQKSIKASLRLEQFYSTDSVKRDYQKLSQFLFQYKYKKLELQVGNFYETLGRGLLFRSFEIPASIKEEKSYRARQGFYRDLQGVSFKYTGDVFKFKAIRGKPLNVSYPPGNENQRTELIEAVQPEVSLWNQGLGLIGMRHNQQGVNIYYSGIFLKGSLPLNLTYYGEYSRDMSQNPNVFEFGEEDRYGAYFSLNHAWGNYGASLELKKYHDFIIGTGISDPPTLVKEQTYRLLNRSTHIPQLYNETGYQIEVYYLFNDGKMLTANTSRGSNNFVDTFIFSEYFLELYWPFQKSSNVKTFIDFSKDEIADETKRYAGGIYYTQVLKNNWSVSFESEYQQITRINAISQPITNVYLGLIIGKSTKISANLYYEYTSDETVADRPDTDEIETSRHFYGLGATYRPNFKNTFVLFTGERRGGPACTSGICYEVLDFRGAEIRWTIKF